MDPIPFIVIFLLMALWYWMCWDMVHNEDLSDVERGLWGVAFVFLSVVAAGFYYFTQYRRYRPHK